MFINEKSRNQSRWKKRIYHFLLILFFIFAYYYALKSPVFFDLTRQDKNTLNEQTIEVLKKLENPLFIRSYTASVKLKQKIRHLLRFYQFYNKNIIVEFIDPQYDPQLIRELGLQVDGEIILSYENRKTHLTDLSEQNLTSAIVSLNNQESRRIYFISGHGERSINSHANFDLSDFAKILTGQGFKLEEIKINSLQDKIKTGDMLVLAGPQSEFLAQEVELLIDYIKQGYHFLWLLDPINPGDIYDPVSALTPLSTYLGVSFKKGVIIDPTTQSLGIKRPDFTIIQEYNPHDITDKIDQTTLFPQALAIDLNNSKTSSFEYSPFLLSHAASWFETGKINGKVSFDSDQDDEGPLIVGVSLSRQIQNLKQHIIIVGDGDFISNSYIANGGNLALALNMLNWLNSQSQKIAIDTRAVKDKIIWDSRGPMVWMGIFFLLVIPLIILFIRHRYKSYRMIINNK